MPAVRRFAEKLELEYPILSDPGKATARAYGVLRLGVFASRQTFIIDRAGKLAAIMTDVKPKSAGADLVATLNSLKLG